MALVAHELARGSRTNPSGQTTTWRAWVMIDDSEMFEEVPGDEVLTPLPNAVLQSDITCEIAGPTQFHFDVWRSNQDPDTQSPWRTTRTVAPNGLGEGNSPVVFPVGGPVQRLDDIVYRVQTVN